MYPIDLPVAPIGSAQIRIFANSIHLSEAIIKNLKYALGKRV